jgi:hypothetical protein
MKIVGVIYRIFGLCSRRICHFLVTFLPFIHRFENLKTVQGYFRSPICSVKQKRIRTASLSCRVVSAQKDLDQATVVPGSSEEIEEKDDDSKKHRRVSIFQIEISRSFHWK